MRCVVSTDVRRGIVMVIMALDHARDFLPGRNQAVNSSKDLDICNFTAKHDMKHMTTLSQVLNNLRADGYTEDFNLRADCLICGSNLLEIHPKDFAVDRHYRFEGMSDPDDEAIVYAISSEKYGLKGVVVNGYGISSDPEVADMIKKLHEKAPRQPDF